MIRSGAGARRRALMPFIPAVLALALLGPVAGAASAADTCPNAEVRAQQGASRLPECRAYEMVSPPDKNGNGVLAGVMARPDGDGFAFWATGAFAGAEGSKGNNYAAVRGPAGWTTYSISPPLAGRNPALVEEPVVAALSDDFSRALVGTQYPVAAGDQGELNTGGFWDLYRREPDGSFSWVSHGATPDTATQDIAFGGVSADLSTVVFDTERNLETGTNGSERRVYAWTDDGLELVSVDSDGNPMPGAVGNATPKGGRPTFKSNVVSPDGSRVVFSSPPGSSTAAQIYLRDGEQTIHVSASQKTPPDPGPLSRMSYLGATPGTSHIAFTSFDALTDDALRASNGALHNLYVYDVASGELTNVSPYDNPSAPPAEQAAGPEVRELIGLADDGSHVYFIATGRLVPPAPDGSGPTWGQRNIYRYDAASGEVAFLGTVAGTALSGENGREVTPDGRHFMIRSTVALDGGDGGGVMNQYLYDLDAGGFICLSCQGEGGVGTDIFFGFAVGIGELRGQGTLSDDGRRVFFTSDKRLLPEDVNGEADAYMWADGRLHLLSSGRSPSASLFVGASSDGASAFFLTSESLVGHDVDNGVADAYVARIGGGFPEPAEPAPCAGDCRPPAAPPPPRPPLGSALFEGVAQPELAPRPSFLARALTARERARLAQGRRVGLRVRVNRAGLVRVLARARLGGRARVVARGSRRARGAGTVRVPVRLSRPARRRLARGGRLRVVVHVRFAGVREAERLSLRLAR